MTDARVDLERTVPMTSRAFDHARAAAVMADLEQEALAALAAQGYRERIELHRALEVRYFGQNHELEVAVGERAFEPAALPALWAKFHATHAARYNFEIPGETIELISIKLTAVALSEKPELPRIATADGPPVPAGHRRVVFDDGPREVPVYDRASLRAGHAFAGPAIVEEPASVTVVRPDHGVRIDAFGHILLAGAQTG
jgi:N-methylhydantoinase A